MSDVSKSMSFSRQSVAAANILFLLYFLAASAPHRVHHFLEQVPSSQDTGHTRDHASPQPKPSDCAVQSVAHHTHLSSVQLLEVPFLEFLVAPNRTRGIVVTSFFDASPFSQRAPPTT
jgi:hypothetical protein